MACKTKIHKFLKKWCWPHTPMKEVETQVAQPSTIAETCSTRSLKVWSPRACFRHVVQTGPGRDTPVFPRKEAQP